jgi:hypothetical protein
VLTIVCTSRWPTNSLAPPLASLPGFALQQSPIILIAHQTRPIHSQWAVTPLVLTEFTHKDQHPANEYITEKELSRWNESSKTHLRYALQRTSSISRMFQIATRSLCITSKHFFRLKLRKCMPDAIALQYSVDRIEDRHRRKPTRSTHSFFLLCGDNKAQVYSGRDMCLLY